jgi:PST family polysaccharide transporter
MTLIKTSFLNAIAVFVKMLTLLSLNKILAVYVGPAGYAALGQFQNAMQMITTFASGAINTGVTKYTAEYAGNEVRQIAVWRTAGTIASIGSVLTALVIFFLSKSLAIWFLKDEKYSDVFIWFAATLILLTFNTLLLAILNGKKDIVRYVLANIVGSLFSLVVTSIMAVTLGLYGALLALAIYQSLALVVTLYICYRASWFSFRNIIGRVDKKIALDLSKYTAMALTSAVCVPISHIFVRDHLGMAFGWEAAGYWEAMWRLSSAYLMLVTMTLSVYYLPKLSELKTSESITKEVAQGYKIILPVAVVAGLLVYMFRDFIIVLLFSEGFMPMRELFAWQLIGDSLKIASWILGYILTARAFWKVYMLTEVLFSISFYLLVICFEQLGIKSSTLAYALNYALHLIVMYLILRQKKILI